MADSRTAGAGRPIARAPLSAPTNCALVEGYKWEPLPKLEVYRPSVGKPPLYPEDEGIVAVASDVARPDGLRASVVWLDVNQPEQVLAWIEARLVT